MPLRAGELYVRPQVLYPITPAAVLTAALVLNASSARAAAVSCDVPFPVPASITAAQLVVFGEVHGTWEVPQVVANHVCSLLAKGRRVQLVLEIGADEQGRIDAYMMSSGRLADQQSLLKGGFWSRPLVDGRSVQDGRASKAMLALLESARRLALQTGLLSVIAAAAHAAHQDPDETIADSIRAAVGSRPTSTVVALMGNVHASGAKCTPWDSNFEGVGYRLRDLKPVTVDTRHSGGTAWVCTNDGCAEKPLFAVQRDREQQIGYGQSLSAGFAWSLMVGRVTASPPAVPD